MAKVALLIGVSKYKEGLSPLPAAIKDIEAMRRALQDVETGGFQVIVLPDPEPAAMQEGIDELFTGRDRDDLALLFFSGHGIKDDAGKLFFGTSLTRKKPQGELMKSTAVSASFVHDIMNSSRCKRQVVILDCCFSGAFGDGFTPKADDKVDVQAELGGEGRAILTSSTSTQFSFEQQDESLSVYTRYVVEGIETGAADLDRDGVISIEDVHKYARQKVVDTAPAMKPEFYTSRQGFDIHLAQARRNNPALEYRLAVEQRAACGEINPTLRDGFEAMAERLGISLEEAQLIEGEVLRPFQERKQKLARYEKAVIRATQGGSPISNTTLNELDFLRQNLGLREEDVVGIKPPPAEPCGFNCSPVGLTANTTIDSPLTKDNGGGGNGKDKIDSKPGNAGGNNKKGPRKWVFSLSVGITILALPMLFVAFNSNKKNQTSGSGASSSPSAKINVSAIPTITNDTQDSSASSIITEDSHVENGSFNSLHFYNEGVRLETSKRPDLHKAIEQYNLAIKANTDWGLLNPSIGYYGLASAYDNRGNDRTKLGDPHGALDDLNKAISLQPNYGHAYEHRGDALSQTSRKNEAIADYNKANVLYLHLKPPNKDQAEEVRHKASKIIPGLETKL